MCICCVCAVAVPFLCRLLFRLKFTSICIYINIFRIMIRKFHCHYSIDTLDGLHAWRCSWKVKSLNQKEQFQWILWINNQIAIISNIPNGRSSPLLYDAKFRFHRLVYLSIRKYHQWSIFAFSVNFLFCYALDTVNKWPDKLWKCRYLKYICSKDQFRCNSLHKTAQVFSNSGS